MKSLLLDSIPQNIHQKKNAAPHINRMIGASVYGTEVVEALLEYGSYDRYYFLDKDPTVEFSIRDTEAFKGNTSRALTLSAKELATLKDIDNLILMTSGPMIAELMPIRAFCHRSDWPLTGFIHSVHVHAVSAWILPTMLADIISGDSIVCSSIAGKTVVSRLIEMVSERFRELSGVRLKYEVELPVIPLGTNVSAFKEIDKDYARSCINLDRDEIVLLYFGRFSSFSKCDPGPLLQAFARIHSQTSNSVRLVLAGDDTQHRMTNALKEYATSISCGDKVTIIPNPTQDEKNILFSSANIFISPSDNIQETFGITIIEALAAGLPVIASDWNGYREVVCHGKTGLLVPTYWPPLGEELDVMGMCGSLVGEATLSGCTVIDVDALANAMLTLVNNNELRNTMKENCRKDALNKYDWPVIIKQYEQLWDGMAEKARRNPLRTPRLAPTSYKHQSVFQHYPGFLLSDSQFVELSDVGKTWLSSPIPLGIIHNNRSDFNMNLLIHISRLVETAGLISLVELERVLAEDGASSIFIRMHFARLLKYGMLRIVDMPTAP